MNSFGSGEARAETNYFKSLYNFNEARISKNGLKIQIILLLPF